MEKIRGGGINCTRTDIRDSNLFKRVQRFQVASKTLHDTACPESGLHPPHPCVFAPPPRSDWFMDVPGDSPLQTCRIGLPNGLPRISEFEFGCTGFDGLGLDGLGLVVAYTKHVHYMYCLDLFKLILQATCENLPNPTFGWVFGISLDRLVKSMHSDGKSVMPYHDILEQNHGKKSQALPRGTGNMRKPVSRLSEQMGLPSHQTGLQADLPGLGLALHQNPSPSPKKPVCADVLAQTVSGGEEGHMNLGGSRTSAPVSRRKGSINTSDKSLFENAAMGVPFAACAAGTRTSSDSNLMTFSEPRMGTCEMLLSEFWKKTWVSEAPGMVMKLYTMAMDPAMGSGTIASGAEMEAPWMQRHQ
ncbi:hypothetical protein B0H13DRAFT_1887882 [Mycena leptocephala]|nr:hypothetical protein B0H13DRAFT_1887882 [Mycena leptocephala]